MAIPLLESYLDNGVRVPHFFNGRILDADALQTEQIANRQSRRQLGSAAGSGVAWGFTVEIEKPGTVSESPVLRVSEGVAINRAGQTLELRLSPRPDDCAANNATAVTPLPSLSVILEKGDNNKQPVPNAGKFALCGVPTSDLPQVEGVFVLTVSPASGFQGRAPMKSLSTTGKDAGCGSRYEVEGVVFRMVGCPPLPPALADVLSDGTDNPLTLQSRVAHWCYGSPELLDHPDYPFAFPATYGALDALRQSKQLDDCDVPLALIYWSGNAVKFCDMWAVRRSLAPVLPAEMFPVALGQRRIAESVAQFLQFQTQLAAIPVGSRRNLDAKSQFRFLPAAGYLPLGGQNFDEATFFAQFFASKNPPLRYSLDPAWVRLLLSQSWLLDPIDLNANPLPPLTLYLLGATGEENYLLFARQSISKLLELKTEPTPTTPAPTTDKAKSRIFVTVVFRSDEREIRFKTKRIAVTATDELGTNYQGQLYNERSDSEGRNPFNNIRADNEKQFYVFDELEEGKYTVKTQAIGFATDTQITDLDAGESARITAVLVRSRKREEGEPNEILPDERGGWINEKYKKAFVLDKYLLWQEVPPLEKYQVIDPPRDIMTKYSELAEGLQKQFPDAPISPSDIQVYVDPLHDPANVAQDFYAYVRMGQTYLPLLLVASDLQTDATLSIGKSEIGGIDSDMQSKLAGIGITTINALAATPTKLLSETLGFDTGASASLVTSARAGIGGLKESPLLIAGVTGANVVTLAANGFDSVTKLADAEPSAIATALGVTEAVATRMVTEAGGMIKGRAAVTGVEGITAESAIKLGSIGVSTLSEINTLSTEAIALNLNIEIAAAETIRNNVSGMIKLGGFNR